VEQKKTLTAKNLKQVFYFAMVVEMDTQVQTTHSQQKKHSHQLLLVYVCMHHISS